MSLHRPTVLLIDDDRSVRDSLGRVLRVENFDVVLAENGKEALREAIRTKVDFVVLDLNLGPEESGWETFRALSELSPSRPILVMTGEPDRLAHSAASRAAALLIKPLDLGFLFRRLRELTIYQQPASTQVA